MNSSQTITVEMVDRFLIHENYEHACPATHGCRIFLKDGRKVKTALQGPEIHFLIQAIAKEKIAFKRDPVDLSFSPQNIDHFKIYDGFWEHYYPKQTPPSPNQILTSAFYPNKKIKINIKAYQGSSQIIIKNHNK